MIAAVNRAIDWLEDVTMVAAISAATVVTTLQVTLRYVFDSPLIWAGEFVIYSIICMSFIGASMGVRHGLHISVDVLQAVLPPSWARWVRIGAAALGIVFAVVLGVLGWQVFQNMLAFGQRSPAMQIPIAWVYLPIVFGSVLMVLRYLHVIVETWRRPPKSLAEEIAEEKDRLV